MYVYIYKHTRVCVCGCVCVCVRSVAQFATPWTLAHQAPLSLEFSRQEYWRGLPFLTSEDLLNSGIKSTPLASPALTGRLFTTMPPGNPICVHIYTHMYIYIYISIDIYMYIYVYTHMCIYTCVCVYIYMEFESRLI